MRKFLEWWVLFLFQISLIGVAFYFDLINWVWTNDITKLSFVIFGIWLIMSIKSGIHAFQYDKLKITKKILISKLESNWFASDQCLTLGMLGTVIGFLIMMGSIATSNEFSEIQNMLRTMSIGMSTALLTTAVGMVFGNLIKLQAFLCER